MDLLEAEAVEDLFRFALLMTGDRRRAFAEVVEGLSGEAARLSLGMETKARWIGVARQIWDRLRKKAKSEAKSETGEGGVPEELRPFLQGLSLEPRAVVALRALGHLEVAEIAEVLRLKLGDLRGWLSRLHEDRLQAGLDEALLRDGVAGIRSDPQEHAEFLKRWQGVAVGSSVGGPSGGRWERRIGGAAVVFGVLFMAAFLYWERWTKDHGGPVREQVARILEWNEGSNRVEFEPFDGGRDRLEDWLYLRGMESVKIPPAWSSLKVVAARVSAWKGGLIAQLIADEPRAVLFIVNGAAGLEMGGPPTPGSMSYAGWSASWQAAGAYLAVLATPGDSQALEAILKSLSR